MQQFNLFSDGSGCCFNEEGGAGFSAFWEFEDKVAEECDTKAKSFSKFSCEGILARDTGIELFS